jgi:hypothetical protein
VAKSETRNPKSERSPKSEVRIDSVAMHNSASTVLDLGPQGTGHPWLLRAACKINQWPRKIAEIAKKSVVFSGLCALCVLSRLILQAALSYWLLAIGYFARVQIPPGQGLTVAGHLFGFRASDFFRISDFGFRISFGPRPSDFGLGGPRL